MEKGEKGGIRSVHDSRQLSDDITGEELKGMDPHQLVGHHVSRGCGVEGVIKLEDWFK